MSTPSARPVTLCVGHVTHDRYPTGVRAGGSAAYGARAFHALGAASRLVTAVGLDFACHEELRGVEVAYGTGTSTTVFENIYHDGHLRQQWVHALAPPVTPELLPSEWSDPDVLFLAPVCGEIDLARWLSEARSALVGLGLQGLLRQRPDSAGPCCTPVRPRSLQCSDAVLRRVGVTFASDEDLASPETAGLLDQLRKAVGIVVVTSGAHGATIYVGDRVERVGVVSTTAIDPTGAGDTFAAALLFALHRGDDVVHAARLASAAASIVVEAEAGSALCRLGEAEGRMRYVAPPRSDPPHTSGTRAPFGCPRMRVPKSR